MRGQKNVKTNKATQCEKCKAFIKLNLVNSLGTTEHTCPNCNTEISFSCHTCNKEFEVKETKQCSFCGFYFCPKCDACGKKCTGKTKFNEIMKTQELNTEKPPKPIHGFKNQKEFELYQLIGQLANIKELKICPRKIFQSMRAPISKLYLHSEKLLFSEDNDALQKRKEEFTDKYLTKEGETFTLKKIKENGREGKEERILMDLFVCQGKCEVTKLGKIWTIKKTAPCNYFEIPGEKKRVCPKCNKQFDYDTDWCDHCIISKGKNKGSPQPLSPKPKKRLSGIKVCSCPYENFEKTTIIDIGQLGKDNEDSDNEDEDPDNYDEE